MTILIRTYLKIKFQVFVMPSVVSGHPGSPENTGFPDQVRE